MQKTTEGNSWLAWSCAVVLPVAALLLHLAFGAHIADPSLLILFVAPIALSAFTGGLGPGVLATGVATLLASRYLLPSADTLPPSLGRDSVVQLSSLILIGVLSSGLIEALRRRLAHLQRAVVTAEARLAHQQASEEQFSVVFHSAPVAIMIVRLSDGCLVDANSTFVDLWGYSRAEALGRTSTDLHLWVEPAQLIQKLRENRHSDAQELQIRRQNGEVRDVLTAVTLIRFEGSAHLLITVSDMTERNRARALEHIAHHDTLTNLPNRLMLHENLRSAVDRHRTNGGSSAVLFIDLDRFKNVNDTLGHEAGDELLQLASRRLADRIQENDMIARFGGDEFVVVLDGLTDQREAEAIAADLVRLVSMPFVLASGREARIGACVGVAHLTAQTVDVDALIRQADVALYEAKDIGPNTVRVFHPQSASGALA